MEKQEIKFYVIYLRKKDDEQEVGVAQEWQGTLVWTDRRFSVSDPTDMEWFRRLENIILASAKTVTEHTGKKAASFRPRGENGTPLRVYEITKTTAP